MTVFQEPHLSIFMNNLKDGLAPDDLGGKPWMTFCKGLEGVSVQSFAPSDTQKGKISRSEIFALAADDSIDTPTVCAAILAWGGMYMTNHKDLFLNGKETWLEVAERLRRAEITRREAYDSLRSIRAQRGLVPDRPSAGQSCFRSEATG